MTHLDFLSSSRKVDAKGRLALKKDCDEVYPQIIIGTGDCIKDVSDQLNLYIQGRRQKFVHLYINELGKFWLETLRPKLLRPTP